MRTRRGRRHNDQEGSDESDENNNEEDEEEYNEDEDDEDDEYHTDDEEEETKLIQTKSLLFLCQEGQIRLARQRLQMLQQQKHSQLPLDTTLKKEIFQIGHDKNYPLHEVIMGGTLENSSKNIIPEILQIGKQWKGPFLIMLNAQPPSHGRTVLHWAAWGNASLEILRAMTMANPEALILKDNKTHGARTPLEIFQRYHHHAAVRNNNNGVVLHEVSMQKVAFLESSTRLWTQHRLRLAVYKAALHWFRRRQDGEVLVPFDKKGRKESGGITPKNWFCFSVLGYCLQREMEPLLWRILGFVGGKAQIAKGNTRKRRRT